MSFLRLLPALLVSAFVALGSLTASPAPVILISFDGFRWDYLQRHPAETATLRELARQDTTAEGLIPVFPSNTFPNHYAIVTGLYPSHSGMLNNRMFDAALGERFQYNQSRFARDARWWGGEPIWVTAIRQGRTAACSFWPGSEAAIGGIHPTHWKPYDYSIPFADRLEELVAWLKVPAEQRPAIVTFYFEETNGSGHRYGPDSPELIATLRQLDGQLRTLIDRLRREDISANFVVVSDHGMTPSGPDRVVVLDDYIDVAKVQIDFEDSVAGLRPAGGVAVADVVATLAKMPHAKVYRAEDLPSHLHIDPRHPRVPPVWILPDEGWHVQRRSVFTAVRNRFVKGQHGYDPALPSMHGIFIASGPAFRAGLTVPRIENVHVYNLLCAAAGITPAPNDGDDRLVRAALAGAPSAGQQGSEPGH